MTNKEYNGWYNYETWLVNLWIDSTEGSQSYWAGRAQEAFDNAEASRPFTKAEQATLDLSNQLKEETEESSPLTEATLFTDLLNGALSEVNWHEIAGHWVENVASKQEQTA